MLHILNSAKETCFERKSKPHIMSEKRHKINKFANYQNIIVETVPPHSRPQSHSAWFVTNQWSSDQETTGSADETIEWSRFRPPCFCSFFSGGGGWGRWLYCFPPKFLDPLRLPVWRHIVTRKSLGSLVQISKGHDSYLDERDRGKAKKLANIAIYR